MLIEGVKLSNGTVAPVTIDDSGRIYISSVFGEVEIKNDSGNPVPVSSSSVLVAGLVNGGAFTRPSDTTAYAAKDVISNSTSSPYVITFAGMGRVNGGSGTIVKTRLMTSQKTCTAQLRLHLFHTAPTATNDNSPYLYLYANAAYRVGMIDFPAMNTEDPTNSTAAGSMRPSSDGSYGPPNLWYKCAANDTALYGVLETLTGFTPDSAQAFYVELGAELN